MAYVKDHRSSELRLMVGEREVVVHDRDLVTRMRNGGKKVIAENLPCPPVNVGKRSTPGYAALSDQAVHRAGAHRIFAGQRADAFHVDLGSVFRPRCHATVQRGAPISTPNMNGVNSVQSYNVHTWQQVPRLGNPLFNEVIVPMAEKDVWNAAPAHRDRRYEKYVNKPELQGLLPVLYLGVFPTSRPTTSRGSTSTRSCSPASLRASYPARRRSQRRHGRDVEHQCADDQRVPLPRSAGRRLPDRARYDVGVMTTAHVDLENPWAGQGSVLLDIGGDIGALVVTMPTDRRSRSARRVPRTTTRLTSRGTGTRTTRTWRW